MASNAEPAEGGREKFKLIAQTQEEEDAFDFVQFRQCPKPSGVIGSVGHMVKGALGGGILSGHVAYMKAGVYTAIALNIGCGVYIAYCLYILVMSAQVLYRRTRVPTMSYPDVGEAAVACFPNSKVSKYSKVFRYTIDTIICIELFGACATYQIIIAKTIKQLVENTQRTSLDGLPGYPELRVYMACMIIPIIIICLIRHLKWLAPFSIVANMFTLFCIALAVYYAFEFNPKFENMVGFTRFYSIFEYTGMAVFSMSCAGVVIPIENNMKEPKKYPIALFCGMSIIISFVFLISFFGYAGFLDKCESPIIVNFPMTLLPKILKGLIAAMVFVTHALNFWVPFNLCFYYIKKRHNGNKIVMWEMVYRALFVLLIAIVAILFPNINALMGFLGAFCLSNMAFIWPNVIQLLVIWYRPGLGRFKWRLWRSVILILIGLVMLICGTVVNFTQLILVFIKDDVDKA